MQTFLLAHWFSFFTVSWKHFPATNYSYVTFCWFSQLIFFFFFNVWLKLLWLLFLFGWEKVSRSSVTTTALPMSVGFYFIPLCSRPEDSLPVLFNLPYRVVITFDIGSIFCLNKSHMNSKELSRVLSYKLHIKLIYWGT